MHLKTAASPRSKSHLQYSVKQPSEAHKAGWRVVVCKRRVVGMWIDRKGG